MTTPRPTLRSLATEALWLLACHDRWHRGGLVWRDELERAQAIEARIRAAAEAPARRKGSWP